MAEIVFGMATSHGPQLRLPLSGWQLLQDRDIANPQLNYPALLAKADPRLVEENSPEIWEKRYDACQVALRVLKEKLAAARVDAVVVVGDDQHEQFLENNMPMFSIFYGDSYTIKPRQRERRLQPYQELEASIWPKDTQEAPAAPDLARHLISSLREHEFDIATTDQLDPKVGLGHAFMFHYRFFDPEASIPMVPLMVNTYFPPNQPTPRRCYALGRALRSAIEAWPEDRRVAVIVSGGMTHIMIDEEFDHEVLDALVEKDVEHLCSLDQKKKLVGGTSEILNVVAVAAAMEREPMTLIDYVPAYRTAGGTGHADAFTYWE